MLALYLFPRFVNVIARHLCLRAEGLLEKVLLDSASLVTVWLLGLGICAVRHFGHGFLVSVSVSTACAAEDPAEHALIEFLI